jgi:NADPH oxidase
MIERVIREIRARFDTTVTKMIIHPSKVIEIQFRKPSFKQLSGQYAFICCPDISPYQWHPFTLTSAQQEDYASVHVRIVGDWTQALEKLIVRKDGVIAKPPKILIDGPYGTASEDLFKYEIGKKERCCS